MGTLDRRWVGEGVGEQEEDHDRWWKMVGLANANRDSLNVCVCVCVGASVCKK